MPSRPAGPGRPKDPEKRSAILAAAKQLFPELGFEGTSMDAIATSAGVSKLTVYSHFDDKETLYVEAIRSRCEEQMPLSLFDAPLDGSLRAMLLMIARSFFQLVSSPQAISLHRALSNGSASSKKLGQLFWQAGPMKMQQGFADFLQRADAAGKLDVPDPMLAASQFFCLLKGEMHARLVFGCDEGNCDQAIDKHLSATVDMFLRAYLRG